MAEFPDGRDVDESTLRLGEQLGLGGQGRVVRVRDRQPPLVFKQYIKPGANPDAMKKLVELPASMGPGDRERLLRQTAWPLARVMNKGIMSGFLMQEIPDRFFGRNKAGTRKGRELQFLLYTPNSLWGDITPPDAAGRVEVARQFTALVQLLHSYSLVLGDVSMTNVLWTVGGQPGVFLIDCDSMRRLGSRPVLPQPFTVDWNDPGQSGEPDLDTDRYKLALMIGRVLCRHAELRPGQELPLQPGLPDRVVTEVKARWLEAARARGGRPDAHQWLMALSDRDAIRLAAPPPRRVPPQVPSAESDEAPKSRPSIRLTPPPRDPR